METRFSLKKKSICNKWNNCTSICLMLLRYFTFLCIVDTIFKHYVAW